MKLQKFLLVLPLVLVWATPAAAIQINWGSPVDSVIRDSFGVPLNDTFIVQMGYFENVLGNPFVPTADNAGLWSLHWKVFDQASVAQGSFDPATGYFTSSASLLTDGTSSSASATPGVNFSNQQAYVWIFNSTTPGTTTEWFLGRSATTSPWDIPAAPIDCCDNEEVLDWSVSDLTLSDIPVYGSQGGVTGEGAHTNSGNYALQTFTFVPEPSSAMMLALGGLTLLLRRRRAGGAL